MNHVFCAAKFVFFSLIILGHAVAGTTRLPIVTVAGKACDKEERVSTNIRLEADKDAPAYCFSKVNYPDGREIRYPHSFNLYAVTVTDYQSSFSLDMDVQERLKDRIFDYYPSGVPHGESTVNEMVYFKQCNFQMKEVLVYTQETTLIIRDSFYNRLDDRFKIPQGTTRTADYSLNRAGDRIRFKVFVLKQD